MSTTNIAEVGGSEQASLSAAIRTAVKRLAAGRRRGLRDLASDCGVPYARAWNQLNRGNGVLADLVAALAQAGIDDPLRMVADEAGYDIAPKLKFLRRAHPPTKPVRSYALDLHHACAGVTQAIEEALADECLDDRDRVRVLATLHTLRREMAELEARIGRKERP